jgi:capsular exopolysaccharide synthesis family protein
MDARRALLVLRRWWPLLVAGTLIAAGAAYAVSKTLPRVYEATALLRVNPGLGTVGGGLDFDEVQASWSQAADDAQLIHTAPIAQAAIDRVAGHLHHPVDAGTLLKDSAATAAVQSPIVALVVHASNPSDASLLANAMATVSISRDAQMRTAGLAPALAQIKHQIASYSADYAAAQRQINQLALHGGKQSPAQQAQSTALFQRASVDPQMVWKLQQTANGLALRLANVGATLSLAQPATPSVEAISPRPAVNALLAGLLALLVLLGVALLADAVDKRPQSPAEVAATLDLPLLGLISPAPRDGSALVMLDEPTSPQADEYRAVRAGLGLGTRQVANPGQGRVIAVAGVRSGDGTTTIAANLAAVAARAGMHVVLVDANARHPALHKLFSLPEGAGLAAALRDGLDPLSLLQESSLSHLHMLVAGHTPAEAIDLLGSQRMRDVLATLRTSNDVIVLDAATAADAAVVSALADATLVVARMRGTDQAALVAAGRHLRRASAHLVGTVVTSFPVSAAAKRAPQARAAAGAAEAGTSGRAGLGRAK